MKLNTVRTKTPLHIMKLNLVTLLVFLVGAVNVILVVVWSIKDVKVTISSNRSARGHPNEILERAGPASNPWLILGPRCRRQSNVGI